MPRRSGRVTRPRATRLRTPKDRTSPATGRPWWFAPALLILLAVAYGPARHGAMVWDDDRHVTSAELQSAEGLWRIWTDLGATQQYYPLAHTAFWVQHRLWGDGTTGYHLVNIALHGLSATLLLLALRRLGVPGAPLAALVFAVHPVHVESVAWITELKNTLSGVFCLSALLAYLAFDESRRPAAYAAAFGLFLLALLSKSVTATLPAALLVIFWWRRGSIGARRDVAPLLPFFAVGLAAGLFTAWAERVYIGAAGTEFDFSLIERLLIAGRVVWFYLAKLLWPAHLVFTYPRWTISQTVWWQYLFPLAALALTALLWRARTRSRAPLAAWLLFVGTLFPVLGLFNVYPFRFSFVADHFQYLASIPIIALATAALSRLAARLGWPGRAGTVVLALLICTPLALRARTESRQYADAEALYRTTIARNPSSWMAHSNLGRLLLDAGREEGISHIRAALRLKPDLPEARINLANALLRLGRPEEALAEAREVQRLDPDRPEGYNHACSALRLLGRQEEALSACDAALRLDPHYPEAQYNRGFILRQLGRTEDALAAFREAIRARPDYADAHYDLGLTLLAEGRAGEAVVALAEAARLAPTIAQVHNDLAVALTRAGRPEEALPAFAEALRLAPGDPNASFNLANTLVSLDRFAEAVNAYRVVLAANPDDATAHNNLGLVYEALGRPTDAAREFREVLRITPDSREARENLRRVARPPD